jgi:formamidopyrimidine-DNA glycosylase
MPELPDLTVYIEALERRIVGQRLTGTRLVHPFVLRTYEPPIAALQGRRVERIRRLGKRIAIGFEGDLWLAIHLMIAGRLHWSDSGAARSGPAGLARFDFETGTLTLTEAGSKRRASLAVVAGSAQLAALTPPGIEVLEVSRADFAARLAHENHTVKRALTDPRLFAGIGNAYSDEILHRARLSPFKQTRALSPQELQRLFEAARAVLAEWTERLRKEAGDGWPEKITAFRPEMAVHGRYKLACPDCGAPVQRIVYADNEANYCARCQTEGRLLADRALSRLLKDNWPKTIEELDR